MNVFAYSGPAPLDSVAVESTLPGPAGPPSEPPAALTRPQRGAWIGRLRLRAVMLGAGIASVVAILMLTALFVGGHFADLEMHEAQERGERAMVLSRLAKVELLRAVRAEHGFRLDRGKVGDEDAARQLIAATSARIDSAREALVELRALSTDPAMLETLRVIDAAMHDFENRVVGLTHLITRLGYVDSGIEGDLQRRAHEIEGLIAPNDALRAGLLTLRRHEKDYIVRRDGRYVERFAEAAQAFERLVDLGALPPARKESLRALARAYAGDFNRYVQTAEQIDAATTMHNQLLDTIQTALTRLSARAQAVEAAIDAENEATLLRLTAATVAAGLLLALAALGLNGFIVGVVSANLRAVREFADRLAAGDLSARLHTGGTMDCVALQTALNRMADTLQASRSHLELRVAERTAQLARASERAQERARLLEAVGAKLVVGIEMGMLLQRAATPHEACKVLEEYVQRLFPDSAGALYLTASPGGMLDLASQWGGASGFAKVMAPEDCWGVRSGRPHVGDRSGHGMRCRHARDDQGATLCAPFVSQDETLGLLVLVGGTHDTVHVARAQKVCDAAALAMANIRLRQRLRESSVRDALTGHFNRRYMEETLDREFHRAVRCNEPLSVAMLDIDHFKAFNDRFGHEAGDEVLRALGATLKASTRLSDIVCRFGGEEFLVILPGAGLADALARAEQWRSAVAGMHVMSAGVDLGSVTVSIGVASFPDHGTNAQALVQAADAALYQAKGAGRDRVFSATATPTRLAPPQGTAGAGGAT